MKLYQGKLPTGYSRHILGHYVRGQRRSKAHNSWLCMIRRCYSSKDPRYKDYGGRGIQVLNDWVLSFEQFIKDLGTPVENQTLDRINGKLHYTPDNVRWASKLTQSYNTKTRNDNTTGYKGISKQRNKFRVTMSISGKTVIIGNYSTLAEAVISRNLIYKEWIGTDTIMNAELALELGLIDGVINVVP